MNSNNNSIPILYYHSVANHEKNCHWDFLSVNISLFQKQINYLSRKGYYACDWKELEEHIKGIKQLPKKTVMFHFDDGFLDNWSVVFPIMKQAKFKYSIVITPDFIQKGDEKRPFVTQTLLSNQKDWWGYLNEKEIKYMSESGLVDFQAHGYTHTWYEVSDELVDIYDGANFYPHLYWNNHPEKKPYWLTERLDINKGYPVFQYKKSLEMNKRFFPNQQLIKDMIHSYDAEKSKNDNLSIYKKIISEYKLKGIVGKYETDNEKIERLKKELYQTKIELEKILGRPVEYIVFPGGGNSLEVINLCEKYGYRLASKGTQLNLFGSKQYQINRLSGVYNFPFMNQTLNKVFLRLQLMRGQGNKIINEIFYLIRNENN